MKKSRMCIEISKPDFFKINSKLPNGIIFKIENEKKKKVGSSK